MDALRPIYLFISNKVVCELIKSKSKIFPSKRIIAYIIDVIIIVTSSSILQFYLINKNINVNILLFDALTPANKMLYSIISLLAGLVFIVIIPLLNEGRTIGKTILKLEINIKGNIGKIILRQLIFIFLLGGIINPTSIYIVYLLGSQIHINFFVLQNVLNGIAILNIMFFLFTSNHRTLYDKMLNIDFK